MIFLFWVYCWSWMSAIILTKQLILKQNFLIVKHKLLMLIRTKDIEYSRSGRNYWLLSVTKLNSVYIFIQCKYLFVLLSFLTPTLLLLWCRERIRFDICISYPDPEDEWSQLTLLLPRRRIRTRIMEEWDDDVVDDHEEE